MTENTVEMSTPGLTYECCFCQKTIAKGEHPLDPCALLLICNFDLPYESQSNQQFFCHLECFKNRLARKEILYLEEIAEDGKTD